ncbi:2TM domain-containing protein [Maribacter sp. 2307ULW6-5]|uniref:2TM domain-containing protein n=1 Tax=Maribacter sp. 2307ULW6-5 TaxID=3386275 RepID=UPI0039BC6B83
MKGEDKEFKYIKAKERVEDLKSFYNSVLSYLVFIVFLAVLNYWANQWSYPWFLWVVFGWGLSLVYQASKLYHFNPFFGKDWEERKIRELMEREERKNRWS